MRVWVDVESGTWGDAKNIRILEIDESHAQDREVLDLFEEKNDSWRIEAALAWGKEV